MGWIIFLVVAVPLIGVVAWLMLDESIVRIEPGQLGLLLVHGKATDRALDPGVHWVPALRRRMVQPYPSLELAFRAGGWESESAADGLERAGPPLRVTLGDRTTVTASYTVRFRLDPPMLREIHNRFGPDGIWAAVRDQSARTLRDRLGDPQIGIDDLFGSARRALETQLSEEMSGALAGDGFVVTMFHLGDLDLGRTGEVIDAAARAGMELQREEAEAAMRLARARIDAELKPYVTEEAALRYREVDSWRDLAQPARLVVPPARRVAGGEAPPVAPAPPVGEGEGA
jgi:regulator of protease activity HflC (stomatin/prohibitin superfamily)